MRCEVWKFCSAMVMLLLGYYRALTGRIEDETNVDSFGVSMLEYEFEFGGWKIYAVLSIYDTADVRARMIKLRCIEQSFANG